MADIVEVQNLLARMIAGENFSISVQNVPTAAFDLENRILILPNWSGVHSIVGEYMRAHEVGHAKWTPQEGWHSAAMSPRNPEIKNVGLYRNCLNIIEDVRIERLIKNMLPGYRKLMPDAAKVVFKEFFLETSYKDLESFVDDFPNLNPGDRINFIAKVDCWHEELEPKDAEILNAALLAETWEDVLAVAEILYFHVVDASAEIKDHKGKPKTDDRKKGDQNDGDSDKDDSDKDDSDEGDSGIGDSEKSESSDDDSDNGGESGDTINDGDEEPNAGEGTSGRKSGQGLDFEMLTTKAFEKYDNLSTTDRPNFSGVLMKLTCKSTVTSVLDFLDDNGV